MHPTHATIRSLNPHADEALADEIAGEVERLVQRARSQGRLQAPEGLRHSYPGQQQDGPDSERCSDDELLDEVRRVHDLQRCHAML